MLTTNTIGNSRPLAACTVIRLTASTASIAARQPARRRVTHTAKHLAVLFGKRVSLDWQISNDCSSKMRRESRDRAVREPHEPRPQQCGGAEVRERVCEIFEQRHSVLHLI